ncbi:AraC family transcriptional regulator ligand-binding domain-containing protein [Nocardia tengchongensis]|uniref:AraC family transcriptional regulator ligand-binding domain-containing protein n=1 Tax=Nocardia tengchongensis TaxID=2055889 RepID=UPI0036B77E56
MLHNPSGGVRVTGADSVLLARFVLTRARAAGLDAVDLARSAGIGPGAMEETSGSVPGQCYPRLWELFERRVDMPHVGLRAAERHGMGELGMMDYLLATAPTVGEGFRAVGEFGSRLSGNRRVAVIAENDRQVTFAAETAAQGRGSEVAAQASFAFLTARARQAARARITPVAVTLRERPPRRQAPYREFFGTAAVDFGAETDTFTVLRHDLDRPQHSADPRLAAVLRRGAAVATLSSPPARAWVDLLAAELDSLRDRAQTPGSDPDGADFRAAVTLETVSLDDIARRLGASPRAVQRRLAAAGTSWTRELASARRRTAC